MHKMQWVTFNIHHDNQLISHYSVIDYYEASNILIIFSGFDSENQQSDLWSYDLSTTFWEQIVPTDNRIPGNR